MHHSGRGAKGKSVDQTTQWSDWQFSAQDGRDRSYRRDSHGLYEFRYRPAQGYVSSYAPPTFPPQSTPAYVPLVADDNTSRDTQSRGNGIATIPGQNPPYNGQGYITASTYPASSNSQYAPLRVTPSSVDGMTTQLANTRLGSAKPANFVTTANTATTEEALDSRFKVHRSKYFKRGMIFKVLWSEPAGNTSSDVDSDSTSAGRYGEKTHSKVRRFVIVKSFQDHSICLPLLTYQSQGTRKQRVDPRSHAAICPENQKPRFAPGEESQLGEAPFHFIPKSPRDRLDPMTRLNFSKPYTVEHNVKVMFIGNIVDSEFSRLHKFYIDCQTDDEDARSHGHSNTSNDFAQRPQTTEPYMSSVATSTAPLTTSTSYGGSYTFGSVSQGESLSTGSRYPSYPPTSAANGPSCSDRSFPSRPEALSVGNSPFGFVPGGSVSSDQPYEANMSYSGSTSISTPSASYTSGPSTSGFAVSSNSAYSDDDDIYG